MKKILFVSSDGGRTGAPWILFNLVDWLQRHHAIEAEVVLMRDGALRQDFEQLATTHTWIPTEWDRPERLHRRLKKVLLQRNNSDPGVWLHQILAKAKPDIIYLSTLVLGKYLASPHLQDCARIVSHVHELLPSLRQLANDAQVQAQLDLSNAVISCAPCVQESLIANYRLAAAKCHIIPEFILSGNEQPAGHDSSPTASPPLDAEAMWPRLREALQQGLPIFGIGGNPIQRKGFDLIPLFLEACRRQFGDQKFLFVWIGCTEGSAAHAALAWDLQQMNLEDQVLLIPSLPMHGFRQLLSHLRVLTLLSREDPFPLVVLEAGLQQVPTVCFRGSGGIADLAARGAATAVDYLNLDAFATAVYDLCLHQDRARAVGARCRSLVLEELHISTVAPQIAEVLLGGRETTQKPAQFNPPQI
jgi:glycosyltransferase involved in cell wall biosynthesis